MDEDLKKLADIGKYAAAFDGYPDVPVVHEQLKHDIEANNPDVEVWKSEFKDDGKMYVYIKFKPKIFDITVNFDKIGTKLKDSHMDKQKSEDLEW